MNQGKPRQKWKGRGKKSSAGNRDLVNGVISVHPRGFGFVVNEIGKDIFIPPSGLGSAFSDDRVAVRIESEDQRGPVGTVEKVIRRGHRQLIGSLAADQATSSMVIRPLRRDLPETIPVGGFKAAARKGAELPEEGDWIAASMIYPTSGQGRSLRARFSRIVSRPGTIAADLDAIVAEFDLLPAYSPAVNQQAAKLVPQSIEREVVDPKATVITIDPEDAKDFDDAVSLHSGPNPETMVVGVHIADLAAYIQIDSDLDRQAAARGFTAYLPGRTLHMLPPALAAERCSLREGLENLAHSLFLTVDCETGQVVASRRCHSRLTVSARLNFEQVQSLIDGESPAAIPEPVAATVLGLHRLAEAMRRHRRKTEQFLELETREIRVICNEEQAQITGLKRSTASAADHMVEEFMLAANVAVAKELRTRKLAALYRIHPEPKPVDLAEFVKWVREIGIGRIGKLDNRRQINRFLERARERQDGQVTTSMFLRTLARATYSSEPGLHYGLGKLSYSHFTSPIRRYPDLLVHQQLWAADQGMTGRDQESCARVAQACGGLEKNNGDAYYAALDRLKIRYIQQLRLDGQRLFYEGVVFRVTGEGMQVFIPDLGLFATMPKKVVPRKSSGKVWRSGNVIYVVVSHANPVRGQLLVGPVI